ARNSGAAPHRQRPARLDPGPRGGSPIARRGPAGVDARDAARHPPDRPARARGDGRINREPYIHVREGDSIALWRPASGLVTAMEPIMRACSGTWIAHGGGSADREVVDEYVRVAVQPVQHATQLRRVWLPPVHDAGLYY